MKAVDCLGFAGGFTLGMVQAGFELVAKREMKGGFGVANCEANRHLLGSGWATESVDPSHWTVVDADVVFGNPPCSGFSAMSSREFRGANSKINHCMWAFTEFAARVRPQVAVFESVQLAFTRPDGRALMQALRAHIEKLTNERWDIYHVLHNAYSLGGAAERRRYFFVLSRVPFGIEWPQLAELPVLSDVIGDLSSLQTRWDPQAYLVDPSAWAAPRRSPTLQVDGHADVRNPLTQRVARLLETVEWRPGEHIGQVARRYYDTFDGLPDTWYAADKIIANDFNMGYTTPVRWRADAPARVITGGSLVCAVHPWLNRTITHREAARIMGFPDDWLIEPIRRVSGLQATWGKGITVDCGRWIGYWIKEALSGSPGSFAGVDIGDREKLLDVTYAYKQSLVQWTSTASKRIRKLDQSTQDHHQPGGEPVTEPQVPEGTEATATGRGRPRPQATLDQDEIVYNALASPMSKEELATALTLPPNKVYLSLYRLRVDGRVHKTRQEGKFVWNQGPASAEAPAEAPVAI